MTVQLVSHLALTDVYDRRYALHLTTSPYELAQCIIQMSVGAILFVAWVGTWCILLCRCWVGARVVSFTACWSRDSNMTMMSLCWYMYITFAAALTFVTSTMYLEVAHNGKAIPLLQNGDVAENVLEGNLNPRKRWFLYCTGHAQPARPIPLFFVRMELRRLFLLSAWS